MIPLRDQEHLRQRFLRDLTSRVRIDYFTQQPSSIFVSGREECVYCEEVQTLLEEIDALSERIVLTVHDFGAHRKQATELGVDKVPAIVIRGQANRPVRYFGVPSRLQFPGFVDTLIDAAGGTTDLKPDIVKQLRKLKTDVKVQVLVTPICAYSPVVARAAIKLALQSVRVKTDVVEVGEYPNIVKRYGVRATPMTMIDEKLALVGAVDETMLLQAVQQVAEGKPLTGQMRPGPSTPFTLDTPQQGQSSMGGTVTSSGLILPR